MHHIIILNKDGTRIEQIVSRENAVPGFQSKICINSKVLNVAFYNYRKLKNPSENIFSTSSKTGHQHCTLDKCSV